MRGTLAQLVEQRTENPCVPGSIPGGTTKKPNHVSDWVFCFWMMRHYFYILYSKHLDRFYYGETHDIDRRVVKHNSGYYASGYSSKASDWQLRLSYRCASRSDALYLESFVKRMRNRKFTLKVISDPEILGSILSKR